MLSKNSLDLIKDWAMDELEHVKNFKYQATQDKLYQKQVEKLLKELSELDNIQRKFNVFENATEWFKISIDKYGDVDDFILIGDGHTNYYSIVDALGETGTGHVCYSLEDVVEYLKKYDPIGFKLGLYKCV